MEPIAEFIPIPQDAKAVVTITAAAELAALV